MEHSFQKLATRVKCAWLKSLLTDLLFSSARIKIKTYSGEFIDFSGRWLGWVNEKNMNKIKPRASHSLTLSLTSSKERLWNDGMKCIVNQEMS